MPPRTRKYSRFGRTPTTTFIVEQEPCTQDKDDSIALRHVSHGLAHKLKNPKFKRAAQALTVIATYQLWPAFEALRAGGMSAADAAAKVVNEHRRGCV